MVIKVRLGVQVENKYRVLYFDLHQLLVDAIRYNGYIDSELEKNIRYANIKLLKPTHRVLFSSDDMI